MCAVKYSVHDPRRQQLATLHDGGFFEPTSRPASSSSVGSLSRGHAAVPSATGAARFRGARSVGSTMRRISEVSVYDPNTSLTGDLAVPQGGRDQPWKSPAVASFASRLGTDQSLQALVLSGPRGTALRAVGEAEDHKIASRVVTKLELRRTQLPDDAGRGLAANHGPRADPVESRLMSRGRRAAVRRGTDVALANEALARQPEQAFGAVYEYRDSCGTPHVVASTWVMPERQFALDRRQYEDVLGNRSGERGAASGRLRFPDDPTLVWAGMSGQGRGGLDAMEMAEVRRTVASERAERLHLHKLGDIKPYSRHG